MSVEPAQSNPSEIESKGSRDWIFMLPLCGVVAQLSQAAALGLASYRPSIVFREPNFASVARVHMLWSSRVRGLRVCSVIDEFHSLQRTQCPFDENSLNSCQGKAEESLMSQASCHLAVNVRRAR